MRARPYFAKIDLMSPNGTMALWDLEQVGETSPRRAGVPVGATLFIQWSDNIPFFPPFLVFLEGLSEII